MRFFLSIDKKELVNTNFMKKNKTIKHTSLTLINNAK